MIISQRFSHRSENSEPHIRLPSLGGLASGGGALRAFDFAGQWGLLKGRLHFLLNPLKSAMSDYVCVVCVFTCPVCILGFIIFPRGIPKASNQAILLEDGGKDSS